MYIYKPELRKFISYKDCLGKLFSWVVLGNSWFLLLFFPVTWKEFDIYRVMGVTGCRIGFRVCRACL